MSDSMGITRKDAVALLRAQLKNDNLVKHCLNGSVGPVTERRVVGDVRRRYRRGEVPFNEVPARSITRSGTIVEKHDVASGHGDCVRRLVVLRQQRHVARFVEDVELAQRRDTVGRWRRAVNDRRPRTQER